MCDFGSDAAHKVQSNQSNQINVVQQKVLDSQCSRGIKWQNREIEVSKKYLSTLLKKT